ncbi:DUF998 domain-containing protein [Streptomyces xiamenensis]|uniref:DUF998 domain-containing protein n=1 Tax=Streptomyces xiamenensis TaxID=408015 RepID=UPI003D75C9BD
MTFLLWLGALGCRLFVVTFLVDGWTRPGYRPVRQAVSAPALGVRGWIQNANVIVASPHPRLPPPEVPAGDGRADRRAGRAPSSPGCAGNSAPPARCWPRGGAWPGRPARAHLRGRHRHCTVPR